MFKSFAGFSRSEDSWFSISIPELTPVELKKEAEYKSCMELLKLSDKYSATVMEAAWAKVLAFTPTPSLKSIQSILKSETKL